MRSLFILSILLLACICHANQGEVSVASASNVTHSAMTCVTNQVKLNFPKDICYVVYTQAIGAAGVCRLLIYVHT